jgi:ribose 5-phosphate isomerase RpiB
MKIAIGSDHGGFSVKEIAKPHLEKLGYEVIDFGKPFVSFSRRHIMLLPEADGDFSLYHRGVIQERSAQARRPP